VNGFVMGRALGKIAPFAEVKCPKRAICRIDDDLRLALKKQSESAPGGADIYSLPQPVQHEDMLI